MFHVFRNACKSGNDTGNVEIRPLVATQNSYSFLVGSEFDTDKIPTQYRRDTDMQKSPNIVLIMADQLAPHFTGAYGHPLVKTPHIDALAATGTRFDAAYCNSPLCAPSRASFMSGQLPSRIGTYDNGAEFPASIPTFAHYLRSMGYRTCLSGKMHFVGPDQMHGFEERLTTDVYPADHAWTADWEHSEERIGKWYHNMDAVTQAGPAATTFQYEYDDEATFLARRRIFDYAMEKTAPFAMVVSLIHPHDPYVARSEFWDLYDHDAIDLPETGPADDPMTERLRSGIEVDKSNLTEESIRSARHGYYANVSHFDSKVGEVVKALKDADLFDDTIIIVTSDHGDMLGERGLWYKMNFHEHSARVPLIFSGPGIENATRSEPVSLVDLLPTFLDIAGTAQPDLGMPVDGFTLWPILQGSDAEERTVLGEYCAEMTCAPVLMIRRGDYKYIHCETDPPQLYDVVADPFERTNLAADPAQRERVAAFQKDITRNWDETTMTESILSSQKRRFAVHDAMEKGAWTAWDYNPPRRASEEYVRNTVSWDDVLHRMQYPPPD